jgi:hypothetical protein
LELTRALDVPTIALSEHFRQYQADQRLPFPYLSLIDAMGIGTRWAIFWRLQWLPNFWLVSNL